MYYNTGTGAYKISSSLFFSSSSSSSSFVSFCAVGNIMVERAVQQDTIQKPNMESEQV